MRPLTPGVQAMLQQYPGYRLDVYPSHRSFAAPPEILAAAIANAGTARLAPDGNAVTGAPSACRFPFRNPACRRCGTICCAGAAARRTSPLRRHPHRRRGYTLLKNETWLLFPYSLGGGSDSGVLSFYKSEPSPRRSMPGRSPSPPITSIPACSRARPGSTIPASSACAAHPEINFDTPNIQADSLMTDDDLDIFNGSPERYDWKLVGRQEFYVPYNDYNFAAAGHDYADILKPHTVNPDLMRWELHRVWVVDATLKPGAHHVYSRRTYYFDEDSYEGVLADEYDRRGQIWRIAQGAPICYYELPMLTNSVNIFYDLPSGRYHIRGMRNRDTMLNFFAPRLTPGDFTAEALREEGVR